MKSTKNFASAFVVSFALVASLFAGGCSSKKAVTDNSTAAADTSAMKPTTLAKNDVKLGKGSSGRAR